MCCGWSPSQYGPDTRLTFCAGYVVRAQVEPDDQVFLDDTLAIDELDSAPTQQLNLAVISARSDQADCCFFPEDR
jgi:hypothetical protein